MIRFGAAAFLSLALAGVMPALAAEMPTRKAGLWEIKTNVAEIAASQGHTVAAPITVQQCIDAATDQMMMSGTGPLAQAACPRRDVKRSGDTVTIDAACTFNDKTATTHAVITGSLDSAYTMTVTSQGDALPGGKMTMSMTGKWLGPCTADQKPGDMIMGGGLLKLNILEMQRNGVPLTR
jgi:Protein of unknown function (DUF3617)